MSVLCVSNKSDGLAVDCKALQFEWKNVRQTAEAREEKVKMSHNVENEKMVEREKKTHVDA